MSDPRPFSVSIVRPVRDQYGDRIVVTLATRPAELTCDCAACSAQLEAATTIADENKDKLPERLSAKLV